VSEWTADWYEENYYGSSPRIDPRGPSRGRYRPTRGGGFSELEFELSVSRRHEIVPDFSWGDNGLRCAGRPASLESSRPDPRAVAP
jgi:formylglycine-generating enzyme required for sulfatase activity